MDRDVVYVQGCGEDGRRKILRLYKADAVGMEGWDMGMTNKQRDTQTGMSRDAAWRTKISDVPCLA